MHKTSNKEGSFESKYFLYNCWDSVYAELGEDSFAELRVLGADCFCRYSCGGGCRFDSLSVTDDLFSPNPDYCRIRKKTLKYGIYIMSQLTGEDRDWLRQEKILRAAAPNFDF